MRIRPLSSLESPVPGARAARPGYNGPVKRFPEYGSLDPASRTRFKISEVARLTDLPIQTLHYWLQTGRIRDAERTSERGSYLVPRAEVVRLLEKAGREVPGLWEKPRRRVLVIDDDAGMREFARLAARSPKAPMTLKTAATVEDGLVQAARFEPEVILLDTSFPGSNFRPDQALAFIRGAKKLRGARVVAMVDHPKIGDGMLRGGADAVLQKPFGLQEFRAAILERRKRSPKGEGGAVPPASAGSELPGRA